MRTTIVLPPELLKEAKVRSAERGESLKSFLTRAVEAELGRSASRSPSAQVTLPIFGNPAGERRQVTTADLARALAASDAESVVVRRPTRPRRRPAKRS